MIKSQREELLSIVSDTILVDRAATHGLPEDSFQNIAYYWEHYLSQKFNKNIFLAPSDVAVMMALLKIARIANNPAHLDNYVDGAGYMILAGEPHV